MVIIFATSRFRVPRSFFTGAFILTRHARTFRAQPVPKTCRNQSSLPSKLIRDKIGPFYYGSPPLCSKDVLRFRSLLLRNRIYIHRNPLLQPLLLLFVTYFPKVSLLVRHGQQKVPSGYRVTYWSRIICSAANFPPLVEEASEALLVP
jgi:hypothetical protein